MAKFTLQLNFRALELKNEAVALLSSTAIWHTLLRLAHAADALFHFKPTHKLNHFTLYEAVPIDSGYHELLMQPLMPLILIVKDQTLLLQRLIALTDESVLAHACQKQEEQNGFPLSLTSDALLHETIVRPPCVRQVLSFVHFVTVFVLVSMIMRSNYAPHQSHILVLSAYA